MKIELSDFKADNATLKREYLWLIVEIVIGGVSTILQVCSRCVIVTFSKILLQGSVSMNLFNPMKHQENLRKVEDGI